MNVHMNTTNILRIGLSFGLALTTLTACQKVKQPPKKASVFEGDGNRKALTDQDALRLQSLFQQSKTPPDMGGSTRTALVRVELFVGGKRLSDAYAFADTIDNAAVFAFEKAKAASERGADLAIVTAPRRFRKIDMKRTRGQMNNRHKGTRGIEIAWADGHTDYLWPTDMLQQNKGFKDLLDVLARQNGFGKQSDIASPNAKTRRVEGDQLYIPLGAPLTNMKAQAMFRGNTIVKMADVTKENTVALTKALTDWMFTNLSPDGRMVYLYEPTGEMEPPGKNNMIRQWMGTIAMTRAAKRTHDPTMVKRSGDNIRYNLSKFYFDEQKTVNGKEQTFGRIEFQNMSKLGANGLACLALVEHPDRKTWAEQEQGLRTTIRSLLRDNGRFNVFYKPAGRDAKNYHNFYPGEALLLWATLYEQTGDSDILERIVRAFKYYSQWHLVPENRRPAFIPWQAQAYFKVFNKLKAQKKDAALQAELKGFIFEMTDWLITVMQDEEWTRSARDGFPDHRGRFFSPSRSDLGPPHSASTGVYLEGLIDAFVLARAEGDTARAERYRVSILRGIRSTMQSAFLDDIDMFYIQNKDKLRGAVRARVDRNQVRVDNVQHNLMGIQKVLDAFTDADWGLLLKQ